MATESDDGNQWVLDGDVLTRMRMARRNSGLSQSALAHALGMPLTYVRSVESHAAGVPIAHARAWAAACGRSLAWLLLDPKRRAPWRSTVTL